MGNGEWVNLVWVFYPQCLIPHSRGITTVFQQDPDFRHAVFQMVNASTTLDEARINQQC